MALTHWWMLIPIVLTIMIGAVFFVLRDRPAAPSSGLLAANTARMRATARFVHLATRHKRWTLVQVLAVVLIVLGATLLSTRLTNAADSESEQYNRDIMLCLDVSGSMRTVDAELMQSFADITGQLRGERIGLVIWDSSAVMKFPLTNDYSFIAEQLEDGVEELNDGGYDWTRGVWEGSGSSLIGDGLASCITRFDRLDEPRARTIVLATDNMVSGDEIYTLTQAVELAVESEVVVHGIAPRDNRYVAEMRQHLQRTSGNTYLMTDSTGGDQIVSSIETLDRQRLRGMPVATASDQRLPGLVLVGVGLIGLMLAGWRLRQ